MSERFANYAVRGLSVQHLYTNLLVGEPRVLSPTATMLSCHSPIISVSSSMSQYTRT